MTRSAPVGSICWPSNSGRGGNEGLKFIRFVDSQDPQINEVWNFGSNSITREVHPIAQVDFGAGVVGVFSYDYLTESGRRVPIIGQISIN